VAFQRLRGSAKKPVDVETDAANPRSLQSNMKAKLGSVESAVPVVQANGRRDDQDA
jgi:hypothetical protein